MQKLIHGLHQFQSRVFASHRDLFERLAHGQKPEALFITCSDSRVVPHLLMQAKPGDLFKLRNAGNIIPPYGAVSGGEEATIEYALTALGVRDIIVCGHSDCGAMSGLLHPEALTEMPAVSRWLNHAEATRRIVRENYKHLEGRELLNAAIQENVIVQIENLRTHPAVATRLSRGDLNLHGWMYQIETGKVFVYDPEQGQFLSIQQDLSLADVNSASHGYRRPSFLSVHNESPELSTSAI